MKFSIIINYYKAITHATLLYLIRGILAKYTFFLNLCVGKRHIICIAFCFLLQYYSPVVIYGVPIPPTPAHRYKYLAVYP